MHNFNEKATEYSSKAGKEIPVWMSDKYKESKSKAIEIIDSGKYGVTDGDFWILMNETKSGKMAYTGLIISHNACLKINDTLESKFVPSCVNFDKEGYNESLVFSYCNDEQGIYEVGEVSKDNCKNSYPYAMAYKRLFDRVVLKLSKLAYAGMYSESESDEFKQGFDEPVKYAPKNTTDICEECGKAVTNVKTKTGGTMTASEVIAMSKEKTGKVLCSVCLKKKCS